jgi:hypothetical protein
LLANRVRTVTRRLYFPLKSNTNLSFQFLRAAIARGDLFACQEDEGAILAALCVAGLLITAVNYFQHWGVGRSAKRMSAAEAWDCDSMLTHYSLLGISRHAHHHLHAGRTYSELRPSQDSPKLPHGYFRMIALVLFRGSRTRALLAAQLDSRS